MNVTKRKMSAIDLKWVAILLLSVFIGHLCMQIHQLNDRIGDLSWRLNKREQQLLELRVRLDDAFKHVYEYIGVLRRPTFAGILKDVVEWVADVQSCKLIGQC
jgi:hypothetical protein